MKVMKIIYFFISILLFLPIYSSVVDRSESDDGSQSAIKNEYENEINPLITMRSEEDLAELAASCITDKNYYQAISNYRQAIELNPDNNYLFTNCAYAFEKLERYEEAIEYYNRGISILEKKKNFEVREYRNLILYYCSLGYCYMKLKEYEKALNNYDKIKIRAEQSKEKELQECKDLGMEEYLEDITNKNFMDYIWEKDIFDMAYCFMKLEKYSEAIKCCTHFIKGKSTIIKFYYLRLKCYEKLGGHEAQINADKLKIKEFTSNGINKELLLFLEEYPELRISSDLKFSSKITKSVSEVLITKKNPLLSYLPNIATYGGFSLGLAALALTKFVHNNYSKKILNIGSLLSILGVLGGGIGLLYKKHREKNRKTEFIRLA